MMLRRRRDRADTMQDRLVWQTASLLLAYPDQQRADTVAALLAHITGAAHELLAETATSIQHRDPMAAATEYVETFDLQKRSTMLLTYWTAGDTRNRGAQMVQFTQAYRSAGMPPPKGEAPDHLPVVLEFAATVDPVAGRTLLDAYRVPVDALRRALEGSGSPYAPALAAVCGTLPAVDADDAHRLVAAGPPTESVGLQPFQLTVPPRRA